MRHHTIDYAGMSEPEKASPVKGTHTMKIDKVVTVTIPASDLSDIMSPAQPALLEVLAQIVPEGSFDRLTIEWCGLGRRWAVRTETLDGDKARYTIEYL